MAIQPSSVASLSLSIQSANNSASDSFGRLRISAPYSEFDNKQLYDKNPLIWSERITGAGTSIHNPNLAQVSMHVASTPSSVIRQTKQRFNYQAGKGMLVSVSGNFQGSVPGVIKRMGFFDDLNGMYFMVDGTGMSVVIRSSATGSLAETVVPQANWNLDKLDGLGSSGIKLDLTTQQILVIDFQWLGSGRVRFGFYLNGIVVLCHEIDHSNISTIVYTSTPNLPCRFDIVNAGTGAAASLLQGCASVISEAGFDQTGIIRSVDRGIQGLVTGAGSTAIVPLISIRLKATQTGTTIIPLSTEIMAGTNNGQIFRWCLLLNPVIAGVDHAVWSPLGSSSVEYDISRTAANTLTGGTQVASGYVHNRISSVTAPVASTLTLGEDLNLVQDQFVLGVQNTQSANETYFGGITFRELQ